MPANKKISQFTAWLAGALTGNEYLGGYLDNGEDPNDNIRMNVLQLVELILSEVDAAILLGKGISSGGAEYLENLDFYVDVAWFYFGTTGQSSDTVTLDQGDPTHPRFDMIYVDSEGNIGVIEGTPAADPLIPAVGEDQIAIQAVLINAGATTPAITQVVVYRENVEWTGSTYASANPPNLGTANFASTNNPQQGLVCVEADIQRRKGLQFVKGDTPISLFDYTTLTFYVRIDEAWPDNTRLIAVCGLDGVNVGNSVNIMQHGFDRNTVGTWQLIVLPTSIFSVTENDGEINRLRFRIATQGDVYTEFFLDNIVFATGIPTPPATIPGWDAVLAANPNSGPNSPVINAGQTLNFEMIAGTIVNWFGGALRNFAGALLFHTPEVGVSADGASMAARMMATGRFQGNSFEQNNVLVLTYAATTVWDFQTGDNAEVTLTGDTLFSFTNLTKGTKNLKMIQGAGGGHAPDFNDQVQWPDDTEPTWSTDPGKYDLISLICDGTTITGTAIIGYTL